MVIIANNQVVELKLRNTGPGPLEVFEGVTGEAQKIGGALTTIMQTLNIGADTFAARHALFTRELVFN